MGPNMGVTAILVRWSGHFIQTLIPISHGGSTLNCALNGQAILEKYVFKNNGNMHEICHGASADNPVQKFFKNIFCQSSHFLHDH